MIRKEIEKIEEMLRPELEKLMPGCVIRFETITKRNDISLEGCIISEAKDVASPVIYIDEEISDLKAGLPLKYVAERIANRYRRAREDQPSRKLHANINGAEMLPRLRVRLLNTARNQAYLAEHISRPFLNLSIVPYVQISEGQEGTLSATVSAEMAETFGWDIDEVINMAMQNTIDGEGHYARRMIEIVAETLGCDPSALGGDDGLTVMTRPNHLFGATAMLDGELLCAVSRDLGGKDLYIIPSSIHEVIAVPCGLATVEELAQTVKMVNREDVALDEQLSDSIYFFDSKGLTLTEVKK